MTFGRTLTRAILAFSLLTALSSVEAKAADGQVARFAIVVGNNRPEGDLSTRLHYADDDAIATHRLLVQAGVVSVLLTTLDDDTRGVSPNLHPNGPPRLTDLNRAFASIASQIRQANEHAVMTELLFFFSGHGDVDGGEGYAVLEDGRLTRAKLYSMLAASPAKSNHVFIDACKSFYLVFDKGPGGQRAPYEHAFADKSLPANLSNTGFILSTSSGRDSHEWERYQAGILSHELRSALRGAADANADGAVTYGELGAFLATANGAIANPRYRPDVMVRPPARDLHREVLRWGKDQASLSLEGSALGHVYVENSLGERVLDAHPARDQALQLHLPSERPLFVRSNDESAEFVVSRLEPMRVAALEPVERNVFTRGSIHLALEKLFAVPFGLRSVSDFERAESTRFVQSDADNIRVNSRRPAQIIAGSIAIGAAAAGATLLVVASERAQGSEGKSQTEIVRRNASVKNLDFASAVLFSVAGVAGLTWGALQLWPGSDLSFQMADRNSHRTGVTVTLAKSF